MDVLIKIKNYEEMLDFLNEKSPESDWKFLLENISNNEELLQHLKQYIIDLKCIFKLNLFFRKIFSFNIKSRNYHKIVYDIIRDFLGSNNQFNSSNKIRNLLLVQTVKISLGDDAEKEKLNELLTSGQVFEAWFIEMLTNLSMFSQLGMYYEAIQDYEKSLMFYEKGGNLDKSEQITKILMQANDPDIRNEYEVLEINEKFNSENSQFINLNI